MTVAGHLRNTHARLAVLSRKHLPAALEPA